MFPVVAVAASLAWRGSLLSSANRVAAAVFLLCFAPIIIVAENAPLLELNISGEWKVIGMNNCLGFTAGQRVFHGRATDLISIRDDQELVDDILQTCEDIGGQLYVNNTQYNFQDCLEVTLTNGFYVHHMIANGQYIMDDFLYRKRVLVQSTIETPHRLEALDGATATMVFYVLDPESNPESIERINPRYGAKRFYINSDGNLVITRDMMAFLQSTRFNSRTKGTFIYERVGDILGCSGYDPDSCSERVYTDETRNWTVACCEEQGVYDFFESLLFPNRPDFYDGEDALGLEECEVPSSD